MKRLSSSSSTSSTSTSLNSGSGGNERRKRSSSCNDDEKMKMGSVKKGPWTAEEDEVLSEFIKREGEGGWRTLPQRAGLLRCGKSCRLRWMNYLRPSVKRGQITWDEEDLIVRMHRLLGNRWSLIAGRIPGRTDNEIKNYWNTHLSKKLISNGLDPRTHKPLINPLPPPFPPPPYTSGNPNNNNNNVIISHHNYITTTTVDEMIPLPATIATPTSDYECCDHVNNNKNDLMMSCSSLGDDEDYNDNDVIVDENGVCSLTAFLNSLINDCQFDECDQLRVDRFPINEWMRVWFIF